MPTGFQDAASTSATITLQVRNWLAQNPSPSPSHKQVSEHTWTPSKTEFIPPPPEFWLLGTPKHPEKRYTASRTLDPQIPEFDPREYAYILGPRRSRPELYVRKLTANQNRSLDLHSNNLTRWNLHVGPVG